MSSFRSSVSSTKHAPSVLKGSSALTRPSSAPVLKILTGSYKGKQFRLLSEKIVIGRSPECDVIFKDDLSCSKRHAGIIRENNSYLIESLSPKNPVKVNGRAISSKALENKDKITIGSIELLFLKDSPMVAPQPSAGATGPRPPAKPKKQALTPPRLIFIVLVIGGFFLLMSKNETKEEEKKWNLKTESDILEEVQAIKKLNEEEFKKKDLTFKEKGAKSAFIKGFRDYRKGYFDRALKQFQHCLTLNTTHPLCQSYARKSQTQIERLIQKKIRLGNAYKKNRQYSACRAVFKSVEIMIQDSQNAIYKEAKANRQLCETYLKNQI